MSDHINIQLTDQSGTDHINSQQISQSDHITNQQIDQFETDHINNQ